jgi:hypothetical protein
MRGRLIGLALLAGIGGAEAQGTSPPPGSSGPVVVMPVPSSGATPAQAASGDAAVVPEMRPLLEAIAKATREGVDYQRVTPDLLTQILAKLDKIETKLDKVENAIKGSGRPAARR